MTFKAFSTILSEAKNIRIVLVKVVPQVIGEFTDDPFCKLLRRAKHLQKLEVLYLYTYKNPDDDDGSEDSAKISLSEVSISCILQTCKGLQMLGSVNNWTVDLDGFAGRNRGYHVLQSDRNFYPDLGNFHENDWYKTSIPLSSWSNQHKMCL